MEFEIVSGLPFIPSNVRALELAAKNEGIFNVSRLIQEWNLGQTHFKGPGECLYIAKATDLIVGVGGMLVCKAIPSALRVSRFYVHPAWRAHGIATSIAKKCLAHSFQYTEIVTCNAQASPGASPFWESLGFNPVEIPGITHVLDRNTFR